MASRAIATCSLLAALASARAAAAPPAAPDPRRSVVALKVTGQDPSLRAPWVRQRPWSRLANGLVVEGNRILVTANNIANATLVEVQKNGEESRFPAKVVLRDYDVPLALLEVDDPAFWKDLWPLPLGESVPREGEVAILRWLESGQLESAWGTVRQVRATSHWTARAHVLTLDVTTSMQGAGYSEILTSEGKVMGLSVARSGDQLSAIAAPVLRHFLALAARPPYLGFARGGVYWHKLLNPALRAYLGLNAAEGGVLVGRVLPHGSAGGVLQSGDVLLALDGARIDASGKVDHPLYGKLPFGIVFTDGKKPGDVVKARVRRQGKDLELPLTLRRMDPLEERMAPYWYDALPHWEVRGGLVFQELTAPYLAAQDRSRALRLSIAGELEGMDHDPARPRIVVMTEVLPDSANLGYEQLSNLIVTRVNGRTIGHLDDLRAAFSAPVNGFHVVELLPGSGISRLVLDAAEVEAAGPRVRAKYGID